MITEFILNNKTIRTSVSPGMSLLDFIRYDQYLSGTKIGCREGDCGACTVLIGELTEDGVRYKSMTSCVTPLGNARNKHVVTVEGVNMENGLSPVQQAMVDNGGTQCGFCTVGFVVSFTGYCLTAEKPSVEGAISAIDGNICRCTGYKSIERAAADISTMLEGKDLSNPVPWLVDAGFLPDYFTGIPERLQEMKPDRPKTSGNVIVSGGTDLYVQRHDDMLEEELALIFDRQELNRIHMKDGNVIIGASATATDMMESEVLQGIFPKLYEHMKLISSTPIRNMGTVGGNIVNASPIGDITAWLLAMGSRVTLRDDAGKERSMPLHEFYLDYKVLNKRDDEIVHEFSFPIPDKNLKFNFEKVCKRTYLDIASVNSAIQVKVEDGVITRFCMSAGGVGPTPRILPETAAFLKGKQLSPEILLQAGSVIENEISPISDVRGSAEYKKMLLKQLFFAHFVELYPECIQSTELV